MIVGTETRYHCGDSERRAALKRLLDAAEDAGQAPPLNGLDFLEVLDTELVGTPIEGLRQRILLVQTFSTAGLAGLGLDNLLFTGGARITKVRPQWVLRLSDVDAAAGGDTAAEARLQRVPSDVVNFLDNYRKEELPRERMIAVGTDSAGDFATYRLTLVQDARAEPVQLLPGLDPRMAAVDFNFKVECPSDFDCVQEAGAATAAGRELDLDYLAKDYSSFRRLMLDRLSGTVPDWRERSPADLGVALVELLAHVGDELSYTQDAVATEAYLGTARQRISVRRHARLVDYAIHEGSSARAWIAFEVAPGSDADGATVSALSLLTRSGRRAVFSQEDAARALSSGAAAFETQLPVTLRAEHNEMHFHTWSDRACCLPAGSTAATLLGRFDDLRPGDHLLLEEVLGPASGSPADADPQRRHVVRLTAVEYGEDPVVDFGEDPIQVTEVRWHPADALPFALRLSATLADGRYLERLAVARANVTLADHGLTLAGEELPPVPEEGLYRPRLSEGPLTHAVPLPESYRTSQAPASDLLRLGARNAVPALTLKADDGTLWQLRRDLVGSSAFSRELVAEIENDGRARLRFGDGVHGAAPAPGTRFTATYRVGLGPEGNVGAGAIAHAVGAPAGILSVRNPLPAFGGESPESLEEIRRYAPQAFRIQERAVTPEDYARAAERHPEVQRATATFRWTGSWQTAFVTVDRLGGLAVDEGFRQRLHEHLDAYRLAGYDLEVTGPRFVPLDLELTVCVAPGYRKSDVVRALLATLGSQPLAGGRRGLFHPDNWTFGQSVDLSPIYAAASAVTGVASVRVTRFTRRGQNTNEPLTKGRLPIGPAEIARLDNDPNRPENGRLMIQA